MHLQSAEFLKPSCPLWSCRNSCHAFQCSYSCQGKFFNFIVGKKAYLRSYLTHRNGSPIRIYSISTGIWIGAYFPSESESKTHRRLFSMGAYFWIGAYFPVNTVFDLVTPVFFKAAASCYIELIVKESDNNVKLIVLDRLIALKEVPAHERVLQVRLFLMSMIARYLQLLFPLHRQKIKWNTYCFRKFKPEVDSIIVHAFRMRELRVCLKKIKCKIKDQICICEKDV